MMVRNVLNVVMIHLIIFTLEDETLEEDILTLKEGEEEPSILIQKGKELPYYKN